MNPQLHGGHGPKKHCVSWKLITEGMQSVDAGEEGRWQLRRPAEASGLDVPGERTCPGHLGAESGCLVPGEASSPQRRLSGQGDRAWPVLPNTRRLKEPSLFQMELRLGPAKMSQSFPAAGPLSLPLSFLDARPSSRSEDCPPAELLPFPFNQPAIPVAPTSHYV